MDAKETAKYDLVNAQSWIPDMEKCFEEHKIARMLEFGMGDGTQWFLERCETVVSVEVIVKAAHLDWWRRCHERYKQYAGWMFPPHWIPIAVKLSRDTMVVEEGAEHGEGRFMETGQAWHEIIAPGFNAGHGRFDFAFVDPGIHLRADIVESLFGMVSIIAAHDTNVSPECYGWKDIRVPKDYEVKRYSEEGLGTTFWIRK